MVRDTEEENQAGSGQGGAGWYASPLRLALSVQGCADGTRDGKQTTEAVFWENFEGLYTTDSFSCLLTISDKHTLQDYEIIC